MCLGISMIAVARWARPRMAQDGRAYAHVKMVVREML
jgi:hypothetical protein